MLRVCKQVGKPEQRMMASPVLCCAGAVLYVTIMGIYGIVVAPHCPVVMPRPTFAPQPPHDTKKRKENTT